MISRRALLAGAAGAAATSSASAQFLRGGLTDEHAQPLGRLAARRGVAYGCATANYQLADPDFADALKREATILVAEYEMKRVELEPSRGLYDFSASDRLVDFAKVHGMRIRGHTLCWYAANPPWLEEAVLSTRDERILTDHVTRMVARYRGRVQSWDVVNEVLQPGDGRADALRDCFWLKAFGPGYIDTAFHAARAADPEALLVYNDWGCEAGGVDNDRFRAATLNFLERALARGVPIQALGLQGHLSGLGPQVDQTKLRNFLDAVRAMGLGILVTEHDVYDDKEPDDIAVRDAAAADASRRFLDAMLDRGTTSAVLTWGLSDKFLHADRMRDRLMGRSPRRLPLDSDMHRKPMWHAMADVFAA